MKIKIIMILICAAFLYSVAFMAHRGYREEDDILGISRSQWSALFVMLLPVAFAVFMK